MCIIAKWEPYSGDTNVIKHTCIQINCLTFHPVREQNSIIVWTRWGYGDYQLSTLASNQLKTILKRVLWYLRDIEMKEVVKNQICDTPITSQLYQSWLYVYMYNGCIMAIIPIGIGPDLLILIYEQYIDIIVCIMVLNCWIIITMTTFWTWLK